MDDTWEDLISLNSRQELGPERLGPVTEYLSQRDGTVTWDEDHLDFAQAVARDPYPLPVEGDRELYYGPNHFNYWASGIRDWLQIREWTDKRGIEIKSIFDLGCASGRLLRHVACQTDVKEIYGADINRLHIEWINRYLPRSISAFQTTSVPYIPLPSASVDLVTAFSVFTHIECFDTSWLMEIRRILKPGGVAWLTVHGDRTWQELKPEWPLFGALDVHPDFQPLRGKSELSQDRTVFRTFANQSYSSNVFYRDEYLRRTWGRYLDFVDVLAARPPFQDVVVLRR